MPTYALDSEFDGSGFSGTAVQGTLRTVQGVLREALAALHGEAVLTRGACRLDAGVSARSFVLSVALPRSWDPPSRLALALNARLPPDLAIVRVGTVPDGWDALDAAYVKTYSYRVLLRATKSAWDRRCHWLHGPCAVDLLHELAALLPGEHDLSGFACLRGDRSDSRPGARRIDAAQWSDEPWQHGRLLTFRVTGSGFLYKQVRGLVGAMLAVAQGGETVTAFRAAIGRGRITTGDAALRVGDIAPACGLCLEHTGFAPEPDWDRYEGR